MYNKYFKRNNQMEKKRLTPRNNNRDKFLSGKGRTRLIVDEYDSLNILNMKKQQQLIQCKFCQKQIPSRLMISHKKICQEADKKQGTQIKQLKKSRSKRTLNRNLSEVNVKIVGHTEKIENQQKNSKRKMESSNRGKSNMKRSNVSNIKRNPSKNQQPKREKDMSSSAYVRPASVRKNSTTKTKRTPTDIRKEIPLRYNSINSQNKIKKTGLLHRNNRNYTQNNINTNRIRQRPTTQQQTNNPRRRRNHSRASNQIPQNQSYYQEFHRVGPNIQANFNFINQTLNQQFSMFNNHFSMINDVLSSLNNFMPNVYDSSSEYYFQHPTHTMYFQQEYTTSSDEEEQEQQEQTGLDEETIQSVPKQKYSTRAHRSQQCTICLCDLKDREIVKTLPCCHLFHSECIDEWLRRKGICPVCRQPL